ncbi:MAG: hypothetical protein RJA70_3978, partial [Pseudomonadota bacterium]
KVALPSAAPASEPTAVVDAKVRAQLVSFDCFSADSDKRTQSLRQWSSGGPDGAAWNIDSAALVCELSLRAPCGGVAQLRVLGNRAPLFSQEWPVSVGTNQLTFEVPSNTWTTAPYADSTEGSSWLPTSIR